MRHTARAPGGAEPPYITATTNGRWVKSTYDGLGRTIKVETRDGTSTKSVVETEYAPSAFSPPGKVKQVSPAWVCMGRTAGVTR